MYSYKKVLCFKEIILISCGGENAMNNQIIFFFNWMLFLYKFLSSDSVFCAVLSGLGEKTGMQIYVCK